MSCGVGGGVHPAVRGSPHPYPLLPRRPAEQLPVAGGKMTGADEAGGAGHGHDRLVGLAQQVAGALEIVSRYRAKVVQLLFLSQSQPLKATR